MYLYQAPPNYNMLKDNTASVEKIPLHVTQEIKKLIDSLTMKNRARLIRSVLPNFLCQIAKQHTYTI